MHSSALALHRAAAPSNPAPSTVCMPPRLLLPMNMHTRALPTGFLMSVTSKPSLLEEGTHNAIGRETWRLLPRPLASPLRSETLYCQPWGALPCMGVRGEVQQQQGWVKGHLLVLLDGGVSPRRASCAAGAQVGSRELPFDPPAAVRP